MACCGGRGTWRPATHNKVLHSTTTCDTVDGVLTRPKANFNVTARQAAKQLGVHVETVKRWARTDKVPARKNLAGVWLFDQHDLNMLPVHEVKEAS